MTYDLPLLPHRNSKDLHLLRSEFLYKDIGVQLGSSDVNVNGFVVKITDNRSASVAKALSGLSDFVENDQRYCLLRYICINACQVALIAWLGMHTSRSIHGSHGACTAGAYEQPP